MIFIKLILRSTWTGLIRSFPIFSGMPLSIRLQKKGGLSCLWSCLPKTIIMLYWLKRILMENLLFGFLITVGASRKRHCRIYLTGFTKSIVPRAIRGAGLGSQLLKKSFWPIKGRYGRTAKKAKGVF